VTVVHCAGLPGREHHQLWVPWWHLPSLLSFFLFVISCCFCGSQAFEIFYPNPPKIRKSFIRTRPAGAPRGMTDDPKTLGAFGTLRGGGNFVLTRQATKSHRGGREAWGKKSYLNRPPSRRSRPEESRQEIRKNQKLRLDLAILPSGLCGSKGQTLDHQFVITSNVPL
jgi:hypothetical protein